MNPFRHKTFRAVACIGFTLLVFGIAAWKFDVENLDLEDLRAIGPPLILAYTLAIALLGGFGVPPVLLLMPAAAVWSFPVALGQSLAGGLGASVLGFLMSRYWLRESVVPRIPPKIQAFEQRLELHGFSTVVVLRLLFYLFPPINWMLGISRIPLRTFIPATFLGMLPGTLIYLLAGKGVIGFLLSLSTLQSLLLIGTSLILLGLWLRWVSGD